MHIYYWEIIIEHRLFALLPNVKDIHIAFEEVTEKTISSFDDSINL